jgi:phosphoribosylglycinamide formyltransferase-1
VRRVKVAALVSGGGTNLQALLDACQDPAFPAKIEVVLSNVPTAFALERAKKANVPTEVIPHRGYPVREEYDAALAERLLVHDVELVCLAGFMRLLGPRFLKAFPQRVLNIHPALLPAFPGVHAARQAFAYGVKVAGCTVHFVDEGTDTGPIIGQSVVPVLDTDTEETLASRILQEEHRLYPHCLRLVAERKTQLVGRKVLIQAETP